MKTFEYPHFNLIAESFGRTLADGGDTILLTPGHPRYTFKAGTLTSLLSVGPSSEKSPVR